MGKKIDLHIHSNFSEDADLTVDEIFKQANKASLSAIAITDHDSVQSIEKAISLAKNYSIEYIPAVELSTVFARDNSQQHILGYYIDNRNIDLLNALQKIADFRAAISQERINALRDLNFSLNENKINDYAKGRPSTAVSIMIELFENKKNKNDKRLQVYLHGEKSSSKIRYFYNDYFKENGPAYVPFQSISTQEAIKIIKKAGGIPVIAHPKFLSERSFLDDLIKQGIEGLEAISTYHNKDDIEFYLEYAKNNNLLITAGSDYHGPTAKPDIKLGEQNGMSFKYFERLKDFHNKKQ